MRQKRTWPAVAEFFSIGAERCGRIVGQSELSVIDQTPTIHAFD